MSDVFVSYSTPDRARVAPLVEALERRGWSVWWDRKIDAGAAFDREIENAIDGAKCVVVVWSQGSVDRDWVRNEANEGLTRGILVPVAIDPVRPPLAFRLTQTIDLTAADASLEPLIDAVRRFCPLGHRAGRNQSPFIGRQTESQRLRDMVLRASHGDGSLALISGEAGVGKTRLTREAEAFARSEGLLALSGRCVLAEGAPPYQPLLEQIEQALRLVEPASLRAALGENAPELAKLAPELKHAFPDIEDPIVLLPDQERRYLLHGCGEFIDRAARAQPMLLVFEDLHWAGESTCRLLRHLAERLRDSPVLMIGTYRDTELDPSQPFFETLHELHRERLAEDVVLRRLDAAEVSGLLEGRAGQAPPKELVSLIFDETEGNPFFVEELYRHLDETQKLFTDDGRFKSGISIADTEVPRGVRLTIEHRLGKVSERCRRVLTAAAVVGRVVNYALLSHLTDDGDDDLIEALEEADGAALMEDVSTGREARYQFVHEQIRQTMLSGLSLPRRQRLHLRIADAMEAAGPEKNAGDIAFHLYQAGAAADADRTVRFLLAAAQRGLDAVAFEDALQQLDMAAEVAPPEDRATWARIHLLKGLSLRGAARFDDALSSLAKGLALGEDTPEYANLLHQRGALFVALYRGADALPQLTALLDIARAKGDAALEVGTQYLIADAHYRLSLDRPEHVALFHQACERTIELARAAGDQRTLAKALILTVHMIDYLADFRPTARKNLDEAQSIVSALKDELLGLDVTTMRLRLALFSKDELVRGSEETLARLEVLRDPIRIRDQLFWMITPIRNAGRLERSVELADRAIEMARRLNYEPVQYPTFKALALISLGRYAEAWEAIGQEVAHGSYRFGAALQRLGWLTFKLQLGGLKTAIDDIEPMVAESRALERVWMVDRLVGTAVQAAVRQGMLDNVSALLERVAAESRVGGVAAALAAVARGDAEAGLERARRLLQAFTTGGQDLLAVDAGEAAVCALLALGRFAEAREEASTHISASETIGYRHLLWRLLGERARAHAGLGEVAAAKRDNEAAALLLGELAQAIPQPDLAADFLAQPDAALILLDVRSA